MSERVYKTPLRKRIYERDRRKAEREKNKELTGHCGKTSYIKVSDRAETDEEKSIRKSKKREYDLKYMEKNKEALREKRKKYRDNNKELISGYSKKSRERKVPKNDLEKAARKIEINRDYLRRKAYFISYHAMRRAEKISRTPAWADRKAIAAVYRLRLEMELRTGVPHHVDHIVPLRGKFVCGLHVEYNLRVITAQENLLKRNRLLEELL